MLSTGSMRKVRGGKGSNPGGTFSCPSGLWYVKTYQKRAHDGPEQIACEILAGWLYRLAGVRVPDVELAQYVKRDGRRQVAIASKIVPDLAVLPPAELAQIPGVASGFAVDCWLGNWDVCGMHFGNLGVAEDGEAVRIDHGSCLLYQGRDGGTPKGTRFGESAGEWDFMRADEWRTSAEVFGRCSEAGILEGVEKLRAVNPERLPAVVAMYGEGIHDQEGLTRLLVARRSDILERAS